MNENIKKKKYRCIIKPSDKPITGMLRKTYLRAEIAALHKATNCRFVPGTDQPQSEYLRKE
ncbi:hypothetical protein [Leptospira sp. 'Mane']|uniref:hypothetical protein n=1 Tax=Leptospira sp. 'Mane' TaxID=3387407 RepID=UPI00398A5185